MSPQPPARRSLFWRSRRFAYAAVVVAVLGAGGVWRLLDQLELPEELANPLSTSSLICDASVPVGECSIDNAAGQVFAGTESSPLAYEDIPLVVKQAAVASEDRKFFEHQGLDPFGIARGLYQNSKGGGSLQGGSTITQQYVKLAYLENKRSLVRKVQESVLALKLERSMPKEKILESYLNQAYYGRSATGIEAAARVYFDKPAADLTASEAAFLVGLVRNPARAEPTKHQETAVQVRNSVMAAMVEEGYLPKATYDREKDLLVVTTDPNAGDDNSSAPRNFINVPEDLKNAGYEYILVQARVQAEELLGGDAEAKALVDEGGVRIYTTINPEWQKLAYDAIYGRLSDPAGDPDGSMVTLDKFGAVRVMVGGRDYERSQVNLALGSEGGGSGRQPGSTFKAIVLAEYIRQGYSLDSTYDAPPRLIVPEANIDGTDWKVDNYGYVDKGRVTVRDATKESVNTAYAQMMETVTPEKVVELAAQLGLGDFDPDPSLVLGTSEVSPEAMAAAYLTFDNEGLYTEPFLISRIDGPDGEPLWDAGDEGNVTRTQVMDPEVAKSVSSALRGVIAGGSGQNASLNVTQAAGKTGTAQQNRDAWFAGFTCNIVNVVWMGYPTGQQSMTNVDGEETVTGSNVPARIWRDLMSQVADNDPDCEFPVASGGPKKDVGPAQPRIPVTDEEGELILDDNGVPEYAPGVPGAPGSETTGGAESSTTGTGATGTTGRGGTSSSSSSGGASSATGGTSGGTSTGGAPVTAATPVAPTPTAPAAPQPTAPPATTAAPPSTEAATTGGTTEGDAGDSAAPADGG
ncbi:MAG: transglycosylase domain-containing protein [Microthrixaceae bacterium]|nr:transglycosylase domain-containing protein [Microthrixaceae bacterium]